MHFSSASGRTPRWLVILDVLSDNGEVVASLLGDLLAVVLVVLVVSVAGGLPADCDHLGVALLDGLADGFKGKVQIEQQRQYSNQF